MKSLLPLLLLCLAACSCSSTGHFTRRPFRIDDGVSFAGWEGDTNKTWRVENGAFVGGSLKTMVPHNEFLCTKRSYTNFLLRLSFKLVGTEGLVNGGVQVRSQHVANPPYE